MTVNKTLVDIILRLFPDGGYYVEAGAHDGHGDSQTKWLEGLGWRGLCIEPSLSGLLGLRNNRRCDVDHRCLWSSNTVVTFREVDGEARELSGIPSEFYDHWDRESIQHEDRQVQAVTLHRMLKEHNAPSAVDFLCLDTEGSEPAILSAHNFGRYRLHTIWVEYNGVDARRNELLALMLPKGYSLELDTGHDLLLVEARLL